MSQDGLFDVIGLGPHEEAVLGALLDGSEGTEAELSRATGLVATAVRPALTTLETAGLVSRSPKDAERFVPTPPDIAIEALVLDREERLQRARVAATELAERFRHLRSSDPSPVELVVGRDAVLQRFFQLQRAATEEIIAFDAPPYLNPRHGEPNPMELDALARGVRYRVVYDTTALELPGALDLLRVLSDAGEDARAHDGVPMKFLLADGQRALVPLLLDEPAGEHGLVVHPCALLGALIALFDLVWAQAGPLHASHRIDPEGHEDDEMLLALLAAGLKDGAIARQLGISDRTLRRRIGALMDHLEASSRFAAGVEAARRGWI